MRNTYVLSLCFLSTCSTNPNDIDLSIHIKHKQKQSFWKIYHFSQKTQSVLKNIKYRQNAWTKTKKNFKTIVSKEAKPRILK